MHSISKTLVQNFVNKSVLHQSIKIQYLKASLKCVNINRIFINIEEICCVNKKKVRYKKIDKYQYMYRWKAFLILTSTKLEWKFCDKRFES
jgi:hypothetical protein